MGMVESGLARGSELVRGRNWGEGGREEGVNRAVSG